MVARRPDTAGEAPPGPALVAGLVNTLEPAWPGGGEPAERLGDPAALRHWLGSRGLEPGGPLERADLEQTRRLREAMRGLLLANNGQAVDSTSIRVIRDASRRVLLRVDVGAGGAASVEPVGAGAAGLFARLLIAIATAQVDGTWPRLKACPGCGLAFYDRSRNRSRTWCSMERCGNRAKLRAYRARHRAGRRPAGRSAAG